MAKRFRISNKAQTTNIDLLSGTLKMLDGSRRAQRAEDRVIEALKLVAEDTDANVISAENALSSALYTADRFHRDVLQGESYWLEENATSETAKRSLLLPGSQLDREARSINDELLGRNVAFFNLGLNRHPLWETVAATTATTTNISSIGGKWTLADNGGTADGRFTQLDLIGRSGAGGPMTKFWIGARPTNQGIAQFESVWECEDGVNVTDAADVVDANASGGDVVEVDFSSDATLARRMYIAAGTVSTDTTHLVGNYLVLCRCYVDSGTTAGLQLRSGNLLNTTEFKPNREIYNLTHTAGKFIELGEVQFPHEGYRSALQAADSLDNFALNLYAERTGGSGSLFLDCLVLIPADHMLVIEDTSVQFIISSDVQTEIYTLENDDITAIHYNSGISAARVSVAANNWRYPKDGGVLVIAAERDAGATVTDAINMGYEMNPRWINFAG